MIPDEAKLLKEVTYRTSRSSGKGGQHVNKVSSRVELIFHVADSAALTPEQIKMITIKLASRISAAGTLRIESQEGRTQLINKKKVNEKFLELIRKSLQRKKKRIPSGVPEKAKQERMKTKKKLSEKKELRKPEWPV